MLDVLWGKVYGDGAKRDIVVCICCIIGQVFVNILF